MAASDDRVSNEWPMASVVVIWTIPTLATDPTLFELVNIDALITIAGVVNGVFLFFVSVTLAFSFYAPCQARYKAY